MKGYIPESCAVCLLSNENEYCFLSKRFVEVTDFNRDMEFPDFCEIRFPSAPDKDKTCPCGCGGIAGKQCYKK